MQSRLPQPGEATGYGASYNREIDAWVIHWMPGNVPLGIAVSSFNRLEVAEHLLTGLNMMIEHKED